MSTSTDGSMLILVAMLFLVSNGKDSSNKVFSWSLYVVRVFPFDQTSKDYLYKL